MFNRTINSQIADELTNDLPKYPSLQAYIEGLNELTNVDLHNKTYDELSPLFYEKAILFQSTFGLNASNKFNTQRFYRVRINLGSDEDTNLVRTYSYPPPMSCKQNGRANLKGRSVFYCSNNAGKAIVEGKPKEGDTAYLSVWKPIANRDLKYGICLPRNLRIENEFNFMATGIAQFVKNDAQKVAKENADHFIYFHRFIAERFLNEREPYPLTSWIANEMLYGELWTDFIIYPSIANQTYSCNMAFHPNIADTFLQFEKILKFKVIMLADKNISLSETSIGELKYSNIKWRIPHENELNEIMPGISKLK